MFFSDHCLRLADCHLQDEQQAGKGTWKLNNKLLTPGSIEKLKRDYADLHRSTQIYFVQDSNLDKHFDLELDGDEIFYTDFNLKKEVAQIPEFQRFATQGGEAKIASSIAVIRQSLNALKNQSRGSPEPKSAPQIATYPEKPVKWGQPNTLICLADGFCPPQITMTWKKNSEPVTDEVNITEFYMKQDYSYQRFTYLSFILNPGDMYSCHVEHDGLQDPTTVFWEPEVPEEQSGPWTVICILGIILGIISAVVGVTLLIKERQRLQSQQHSI
ncbi:H-2 class II histocompatibility antigen, A-U alpha chain-like [Hemiscyllium ocellatum]|uniref:H-2 class II histocompatibility antigen, A-U alpha chain-like n=1 Tax=Hemiscyllium ocellatum TaxID=170820 RepID=UPI00296779B1|nr:H-2 class II histocompatibility antigen, A-U alpha chain-like [Hemiscyllium ocellatum]